MYIVPDFYYPQEYDCKPIDNSRIYRSLYGDEGEVFDEEFVVDNIACTTKLKKLVESNKSLSKFLSKSTKDKEVYLIRFHGKWKELAWTLKAICDAGLTFYRNVDFYRHNKTRLLALDFDGNGKYGLACQFAALVDGLNSRPGVLSIPSASCNYKPMCFDEKTIKKFHVFAYTEFYDCCIPKEIARVSDEFSRSIAQTCIEVARQILPWDKAAMSPWLRFFSKSVMTANEIEKDPTINVRFRNETDAIFEYRNFTQIFNKDFLDVDKCEHYIPNAANKTCNQVAPYTVPPSGVSPEQSKSPKKEKTIFRNFWKELKEFAGLTNPGVYPIPHYDIGRLNRIGISERNSTATKILWSIAFNIYSIERFSGKNKENKKAFALEWFNTIFNATNVDDYEEFMGTFNPDIEYERKRDDRLSLELHYENPDSINEKHFYRNIKVGYRGAYIIDDCSSREELAEVAREIGMSRATMYRRAKLLGLPEKRHKPHKSKLDQYINLSIEELNVLVKSGKLNRMGKHRIIQRRTNVT